MKRSTILWLLVCITIVLFGCKTKVKDRNHLLGIIQQSSDTANLNHLDVSAVTNMAYLFSNSNFNGDISEWDVSKVTSMHRMFENSKFNGDISGWIVSRYADMIAMFENSPLENNPPIWHKHIVKTKQELKNIIKNSPNDANLNYLDVSAVTNMAYLFSNSNFNGDISEWDVSKVTSMHRMFENSKFNGDISGWIVSRYADMIAMFENSPLENNPPIWHKHIVKSKEELKNIIQNSPNDANLNYLDVSHIINMDSLFYGSKFNGDISKWDVSGVRYMKWMFAGSKFNGDISKWDVSSFKLMNGMFLDSPLENDYPPQFKWKHIVKSKEELKNIIKNSPNDANLNYLDVSKITNMDSLFYGSKFNGDISKWDVSSVVSMKWIFFDSPLEENHPPQFKWKHIVKSKEELKNIIKNSPNDANLNYLDVSKITNMDTLFYESKFNGDISRWDVSNVTNMRGMFYESSFNGDISKWDVSSVTDMTSMFVFSSFNGDISKWDVSNVTDMGGMFCASDFNGDISNWDVSKVADMSGMFGGIPEAYNGESYFNGDISDWDVSNVTDMSDMFAHSDFNGDISDWNVSSVTNMNRMFERASFNGNIYKWDVSSVTNMSGMFEGSEFNGDISNWNVSAVTDMSYMFIDSPLEKNSPPQFKWKRIVKSKKELIDIIKWNSPPTEMGDDDLNYLDVSLVTDMSNLFKNSMYDWDISSWDVSNVTNMSGMFKNARFFNCDISGWDVSNVTNMKGMFDNSLLQGREPRWYKNKVKPKVATKKVSSTNAQQLNFSDPEVDDQLIEMVYAIALIGTPKGRDEELKQDAEKGCILSALTLAMTAEGTALFASSQGNSKKTKVGFNEAVKYYKKASNSGNMIAKLSLGRVYLRLNQPKKAKPLLKFVKDNGGAENSYYARKYWNKYELWKY